VALALAPLLLAACSSGTTPSGSAGSPEPGPVPSIAPPGQPAGGPGGQDVRHRGVRTSEVTGSPGNVTVFEPADPEPASAPVVVFTQGVPSATYRGWIDHLVARGSIVVFQNQPFQRAVGAERRKGPAAGLRVAMAELARPGHVTPRWDQLVLIGHSIGGNMTAHLAADADRERLPQPRAVFVLQPTVEDAESMAVLRAIPPATLALVLASDQDNRVGEEGPKALWSAIGHIPTANRDYILVRSDQHGHPPLLANHFIPESSQSDPPNAFDFYGVWKLADGLQSCVVARVDCDVALGGGERQRSMGTWADGVPVSPLQVTDTP
jgi:acetyl esterase/lipase